MHNAYERLEIQRFLAKHAITDFHFNPFFPVNTLTLIRGALAARSLGVFERYVGEVFRHMWREPKKMDDPSATRGTFGALTFFVGGEIWFGKDRLRDVEEAITATRGH